MRRPVLLALRLGWALAEVRGRTWRPDRQEAKGLVPTDPPGVLPLRSQRSVAASSEEARASLTALLAELDLPLEAPTGPWPASVKAFVDLDAALQDRLAARDEDQANAYLLGRGLAECWWALGPDESREGSSLAYLLGDERVVELERMLGRLPVDGLHVLTPAAVAGSLRAWAVVAAEPAWAAGAGREVSLREQVRRWYQLLVLGQDPTTMLSPGQVVASRGYLARTARAFWPQALLATLALGALSVFAVLLRSDHLTWLSPFLATGGIGALLLARALGRGKSAAQRLVLRVRQDAYTDLVAAATTVVPERPDGKAPDLARAVRSRQLTVPTPPPS